MAQYLPFIPDVLPEPVIYNPDFNFFDKMLQRKQFQYEQGVNRAKTAYESVLNAPLTNKFNIPLRDQYLKQAQDGLKKVAATDLSLLKNQQFAENLYSPFWQDKFITQDAALTNFYRTQAQKLDSWRTSSDPKVREQYNGIVGQYLTNGLEVLKNADRTDDGFSKVEKREAIPWTNIEAYLEKAANDQKMNIKYDDASGPYLVSRENGQRSKQKFSTWASSIVGNNFYQQFLVTGVVQKEQELKNIKKDPAFKLRYPNATDQDALTFLADDVINELDKNYQKRKEEIGVEMARINSLISSLPAVLDENGQRTADRLKEEKAQLEAQLAGVQEEFKNFDKDDRDAIRNNVLIDPDSYYAKLAKQRVINNWATGRASIESLTIKENPVWKTAQENEFKRADLQLKQADYNLNVAKFELEKLVKMNEAAQNKTGTTAAPGTKVIKDANGNDVVVPDNYVEPVTGAYYKGMGSTDITKNAPTAYDVFSQKQEETFNGAYSMLFDPSSILGLTKNGLGMSQEDLSVMSSYMKRRVLVKEDSRNLTSANAPSLNLSAKEVEVFKRFGNKILNTDAVKKAAKEGRLNSTNELGIRWSAGNYSTIDFKSFSNALIAYASEYFQNRNGAMKDGNDIPLNKEEVSALLSYRAATNMLEEYVANEDNRQKLLDDYIAANSKDPNLASIIKKDKSGKSTLVTATDIAPYFKNMSKIFGIPARDLALEFTSGKLGMHTLTPVGVMAPGTGAMLSPTSGIKEAGIIYRGQTYMKRYTESPLTGRIQSNPENVDIVKAINSEWSNLNKTFGGSAEFNKKVRDIYQQVVPNLLYYRERTGKAGVEWAYAFSSKAQGASDKAFQLFNTALNPANGDLYTTDMKQVDTDVQAKIRQLIKDKEENAEKYIQGFTYKTLTDVNGQPAVEFTIQGTDDDSKAIAGTYNVILNKEYAGILRDLPQNTGNYIYGGLLRGKIIKSDPVIEASGFSFELVPDAVSDPSNINPEPKKVYVNIKYRLRKNEKDATTGQLKSVVEEKVRSDTFDLVDGPNKKTPDELMNYIYGLYSEMLNANYKTNQEYMNAIKSVNISTGGVVPGGAPAQVTPVSKSDYLKKIGLQ